MPTNLVYLVTDSTVANKFGLEQVKYLSKSNLDIHFICGLGSLDPEIKNICKTVTQLKSLKRSINLFNDFKSLLVISVFIHRIKPSCVIYATPKASLLASASSFILGIDNRIYQIWGARWQTLQGVKEKFVKAMDMITLTNSTHLISLRFWPLPFKPQRRNEHVIDRWSRQFDCNFKTCEQDAIVARWSKVYC